MKYILVIIVSVISITCSVAQENVIHVMAYPTKDSVVLRWAPSTPLAWKLLNKYGYRLERYTIVRDDAVLENKTLVNIQPVPWKPKPQAEWQAQVEKNDLVALAAQAIFGETFEIDMRTTDISQIVTKARELESRYSFALFAADISAPAAYLSGLRYVDKDVKKNEKYLYRVYSAAPADQLQVAMGFAYTSPSEEKLLPPVQEIMLRADDKTVMISWDVRELKTIYSGYYIEKSEDNGPYHQVNQYPYVFVEKGENDQNTMASFLDSLKSNDQVVSYRITGITPFANLGPPSKPFTTQGVDKTSVSIEKVTGQVNKEGQVHLRWDFSVVKEPLIKGFEVERSKHVDKGYKKISPTIPRDQRMYNDVSASSTNYYRVVSVDNQGKRKPSFPILIQKEDSIPPAAPINIKAVIDTMGIVHLQWTANGEGDLLGYRVYHSYFKNSEFSQVTVSPITSNAFTDTLNIKTLTRKSYYKITAVDNRFNASAFSTSVELLLPDIIPPVTVSFTSVKATEKGIDLRWSRCSSADAKNYLVYRKLTTEKRASVISQLPIDSVHLVDAPPLEASYSYWLEVVDSAGLKSVPSQAITMKPLIKPILDSFKNIVAEADRTQKKINLRWRFPDSDQLKGVQVYRYENDPAQMFLYKTVVGNVKVFSDTEVKMDTRYGYRLKAVYKNGKESSFSDEVNVDY